MNDRPLAPHPPTTSAAAPRAARWATAPGLIRFAARYTRSLHDAEDAYQRAMEIALTRAPVTEPAALHGLAPHRPPQRGARRRRGAPARGARRRRPTSPRRLRRPARGRRGRRRRSPSGASATASIQDGLAGLTEAQRICLMLQSAGRELRADPRDHRASRCARSSARCWRAAPACAAGRCGSPRARRASAWARPSTAWRWARRRPAKAPRRCRATSRTAAPAGRSCATAASPTSGWPPWSRSPSSAARRSRGPPTRRRRSPGGSGSRRAPRSARARSVQMALDLPSSALAKVGAGTAAVAVAGAAGAPLVIDTVARAGGARSPRWRRSQAPRDRRRAPAGAALPKASPTRTGAGVATFAARTPPARRTPSRPNGPRERRQASISLPERPDPVPASARRRDPARGGLRARRRPRQPAPAPAPASSASEVALEFGP